jgi:hypothetical protein
MKLKLLFSLFLAMFICSCESSADKIKRCDDLCGGHENVSSYIDWS